MRSANLETGDIAEPAAGQRKRMTVRRRIASEIARPSVSARISTVRLAMIRPCRTGAAALSECPVQGKRRPGPPLTLRLF